MGGGLFIYGGTFFLTDGGGERAVMGVCERGAREEESVWMGFCVGRCVPLGGRGEREGWSLISGGERM